MGIPITKFEAFGLVNNNVIFNIYVCKIRKKETKKTIVFIWSLKIMCPCHGHVVGHIHSHRNKKGQTIYIYIYKYIYIYHGAILKSQ